jgi:hypothetical protein
MQFLPNSVILEGVSIVAAQQLGMNFQRGEHCLPGTRFGPGRLLYDSVRDGASPTAFHAACDGYARTLVLISDTQGRVFGFYTPHAWCGPQQTLGYSFRTDLSFSFSLGTESMNVEGLYKSTVMRASIGPCYGLFTVDLEDEFISAHIAVLGEGFESCYFEDAPFSLQRLEMWYMGV